MSCRERAMEFLALIVLDDAEMPIQLFQSLAEFALSMVGPVHSARIVPLPCVVLHSESIDVPRWRQCFGALGR
jgi:hypothetical protein